MRSNPYEGLPPTAFWKTGVAERPPYDVEGIYQQKFSILPSDKIGTAGSCFAQHIGRYLRANRFKVMDVEPAPGWLPADLRAKYGFSTYSARYGNIYTVAQLAQLARECSGAFAPQAAVWERDGRFFDAMRPSLEPDGFDSAAQLEAHRSFHLGRVRLLLRELDVFVFTLGLTEGWVHRASKTVYPVAPGVVAGVFDDSAFASHSYGFSEMEALFDDFLASLKTIRGDRGLPKIILTVSPVPLTATASGAHVLVANARSKSMLRALAACLSEKHAFIDYFPSFEIVTNPAARGSFFDGNLRTVTSHGVREVMKVFFAAHRQATAETAASAAPKAARSEPPAAPAEADLQCEDAILEAFANG